MPASDRIVVVGFYLIMMAAMAIVPVVCVVVTRRAASGRLPRNAKVGIRTPALFASEQAWQAGHRAALPVIGWGTSLATLAGWWPLLQNITRPDPSRDGGMALGVLIWGGACVLAAVVAAKRAGRAARRVGSDPDAP